MSEKTQLLYEFRRVARQLDHLMTSDAPEVIKAHLLVRVFLPKMVRIVGVKEYAEQLACFQAEQMAGHLGLCVVCKKEDSVRDGPYAGYACEKCGREVDELSDELEKEDDV